MDLSAQMQQQRRFQQNQKMQARVKRSKGMSAVHFMSCDEILDELIMWDYEHRCLGSHTMDVTGATLPHRVRMLIQEYLEQCVPDEAAFFQLVIYVLKHVRNPLGAPLSYLIRQATLQTTFHDDIFKTLSIFENPINVTPDFVVKLIRGVNRLTGDANSERLVQEFDKANGSFQKDQHRPAQGGGGGARGGASTECPPFEEVEPLWVPREAPPPLVLQQASSGARASHQQQQKQQQPKQKSSGT
ncbi:hypothetical protein EBZ80_22365 [bacterium]|nr:hypothetical protein [bacterium]